MTAERLRVIHVITKLDVGGAQETAIALCAGLDPSRFDVALLAGPDPGTGGDGWALARARGARVSLVRSLRRPIDPLRDVLATIALTRIFRRAHPTVVHTHSSKAGVVGRLAAWLARVPVRVHTVHGWSFREHQHPALRRLFTLLERLLARITTALVVVSAADQDAGLALGIGDERKYHVIRSGVDVSTFAAAASDPDAAHERLGLPSGAHPVVGTVTRFGAPKDPVTTVAAFASIVERWPDARLVLVGDGPARGDVVALAGSLGVGGSCVFTGVRGDVAALLAGFDVFVLTSSSEGLPRAVVEAMAAGVPVVASAVGGVPELVRDGDTGLLVPPGDVAAVGVALSKLIDDPALARHLVERGRAALGAFDVAAMIAATAELYEALAAP